jgi:predicted DNA-binding protein (MmcQ/YjbR family)
MEYEKLEHFLLRHKGALKEFPFGPEAAVFKVAGKMFALIAWTEEPLRINLKCEPDEADFLRTRFSAIVPGYHMNKKHWNTITLDGSIPEDLLLDFIDASYSLVVKGLTRAERQKLEAQVGFPG